MFLQTCSVEADGSRTRMNGKLSLILEDTGEVNKAPDKKLRASKACQQSDQVKIHT